MQNFIRITILVALVSINFVLAGCGEKKEPKHPMYQAQPEEG